MSAPVHRGDTITGLITSAPGSPFRGVGQIHTVIDPAKFYAQLRAWGGPQYSSYYLMADEGATWVRGDQTGQANLTNYNGTIYDLRNSQIDATGATPVGVALSALCTALLAQGYNGIDGANGTYNVDDTFTVPPRNPTDPFTLKDLKFTSPSTPFAGVVQATIVAESNPSLVGYGPRTWTQTVHAGDNTFPGVADVTGLTVGDLILLRFAADPTDAGFWFSYLFSHIASITPTGGTTGTIVITGRVAESPLYPLPAYSVNTARLGNQHDLIRVTKMQDNLLMTGCSFNRVLVAPQFARNMVIDRPYIPLGTGCFSFSCTDGARIINPYADEIAGVNTGPGALSNYGWFLITYQAYGTVVENFICKNFHAQQGILNEEVQARGTHFTGVTKVTFNDQNAFAGNIANITQTPNSLQQITFDHLIIEGSGTTVATPNLTVGRLEVLGVNSGDPTLPQVVQINADQVTESLRFNGKEYNVRKQLAMTLAPITVSGAKTFNIPVRGLIRNMRVFSSTLTGLFEVELIAGPAVLSIRSFLAAGTWVQPNFPRALWFGGPDYWSTDISIRTTTTGAWPVSGFLSLLVEMWTDGQDPATGVYTDTSFVQQLAGAVDPSTSAQFVGQLYKNTTSGRVFTAVTVGAGAGDWV